MATPPKLRILVAQLNLLVGDVDGNRDQVIAAAVAARDEQRADLVVFPELTLTGYPPEDLLLRPELTERTQAALLRIAAETRGIALILGYPKATLGGLFNVAGLVGDGRVLAEYAKQLLPNYSVFDEKRYFQPGNGNGILAFRGVRIALTVCEDIWEEGPARRAAAAGAELLININASPYHLDKAAEREALVQFRAREQGIPIIYANLVGGQDELVFDGGSFVVDAAGNLTQRAPYFEAASLVVELALEAGPRPMPGALAPMPAREEAVYQALVLGVRDYVRKNGFGGVVLGLSGGIDSALTLAVATDALGPEQVEVVLMPSRFTADMSVDDALEQARILGVEAHVISIEPAFRAFLGMLQDQLADGDADVTEENIQARCRGILLMAISNRKGRMLLTTGNKSEMAVGYATLYGDMAGGFAPLKDLFKTLVYRLAHYRNRRGRVIPERVITRPPSAELRPDQTDQDSLPDYALLDAILKDYIEDDRSVAEIVAAGYPEAEVRRVARLVDRNEYKRRQAPPGVRITYRAFGRDRRYPITSGF
ncbi:MAG: NAD+ synthase [Candidatus Thiosymbion ectosymbiont of Robbea hypermnestra]|nr:NAD+ synthase [Candidatus Thiosymbion ectosymbiont of Robbea hypermnestra]